jgi:hypothetical protein
MVHLEDTGELCDGLLEGLNAAAHVTLQLHGGKDREGLTENGGVDVGAVASNDSTLFQVPLPALTTRWRQADHVMVLRAQLRRVSAQKFAYSPRTRKRFTGG